ncbi:hypothetical protein [Luteolibacter sp. Populi]|uniref:hypothetical protein n=1 Tax=Luteolibacter sp. Populi TaxID=3230487 RepID=UPI003466A188
MSDFARNLYRAACLLAILKPGPFALEMPTRKLISLLVAVAVWLATGCSKRAPAGQVESSAKSARALSNASERKAAQIGEWHVTADSAEYSTDGKTATFTGKVLLALEMGEGTTILDATNDPGSSATFDLAAEKLLTKKGRFDSSRILGVASKREEGDY